MALTLAELRTGPLHAPPHPLASACGPSYSTLSLLQYTGQAQDIKVCNGKLVGVKR